MFVQEDDEVNKFFNRLNQIEVRLDEIRLQEVELKEKLTKEYPFFVNIINQKNFLEEEKQKILSEISTLPKNKQIYINLLRDVDINRQVLESLESKKL